MEHLILYYITKIKMFIYWFITWAVMHIFEIRVGNSVFNIWQFIISCVIFGLLTQFSSMLIAWEFITTDVNNEDRVIVLSIMIASFLYLFIPFVMKEENRGKFLIAILEKFWFYKK